MPKGAQFHSIDEATKPAQIRVHHDNSVCVSGRKISQKERRPGTGGFRRCDRCEYLNKLGR